MPDTNSIGALSEGRVLAALISAGYTVAIPFGVARYDLVLDAGEDLKRVQCKTGRIRNGAMRFSVYSVNRVGGHFGRSSYQGDADLFGVYCPDNDKVYLVPVDDRRGAILLRVLPSRNNQMTGIRWAADYEVRVDVAQLAERGVANAEVAGS